MSTTIQEKVVVLVTELAKKYANIRDIEVRCRRISGTCRAIIYDEWGVSGQVVWESIDKEIEKQLEL